MLLALTIENFALIEHSEVEFEPGFHVFTGESGAGKSILMGALQLLTGGRVDHRVIRTGCRRCVVSGSFTVPASLHLEIAALLEEAGVTPDDSDELIIRRVVTESGVRNFLNDTAVSAHLLSVLGARLVDIHGANDQLSLTAPARQLELLDRYAGAGPLRSECARLAGALTALAAEKADFLRQLPDPAELDRLTLIKEEIDRIAPQPGEEEALNDRYRLAANAQTVIEDAGKLADVLAEGDGAVADQLGEVYRLLEELSRTVGEGPTASLLEDCTALQEQVRDLSVAVSKLTDAVELDPAALTAMEARLSELYTLKRRYGQTLEAVLAVRDDAAQRIELFHATGQRRREFDEREKELRAELRQCAEKLSRLRHEKAAEFTRETGALLARLGFARCMLETEFAAVEPGATGMDRLELLFSANAGEALQPLRKIASSGELSRLMLALKTVLADADETPTVVFDEIDANIGGETANRVGDALKKLGEHRQILLISHLAQVAARAETHFLVSKEEEPDGRTASRCRRIFSEERTTELARMLGGGDSALLHARSLTADLTKKNSAKITAAAAES